MLNVVENIPQNRKKFENMHQNVIESEIYRDTSYDSIYLYLLSILIIIVLYLCYTYVILTI